MRLGLQFIFLQQRQHERVITQRATVIRHPLLRVTARRVQRQRQRLFTAAGIAHIFQRNAQLQKRQARRGLSPAFPDFTQRAKRRFLLTRQHQSRIRLNGKFAGLGIVAIANRHHARVLQIAQQAFISPVNRIGRNAVPLLASAHEEIHRVCGKPVFFRPVVIPQGKTAVITLHLQHSGDPRIDCRTAFFISIARDPQRLQLRRVGIERREQAAGGLLQTTIRISLQLPNIARQVQRRFAAKQQLPLQRYRREVLQILGGRMPGFPRLKHRSAIYRLRRPGRTDANFPLLMLSGKRLARQVQAGQRGLQFSLAKPFFCAYRDKQGRTHARRQVYRSRLLTHQFQ